MISVSTLNTKRVRQPLDDYPWPVCSNCSVDDSVFWTKEEEKIFCIACIKDLLQPKLVQRKSSAKDEDKIANKKSEEQAKDAIENDQGIKRRKGRVKQFTPGKQATTKGKGRRSIFKKCAYKSPASVIMPVTSDAIFYKGFLYQAGDIVSVIDVSGKIYYAQIRGFLQDQYCEKSASLTWLIPTQQSPKNVFDPYTYILGPEEDIPRKLAFLNFVCNCPSDYFLIKNSPFASSKTMVQ